MIDADAGRAAPAPADRLVIVQPWFNACGHPAQSLLHTARALQYEAGIRYLIPDTQVDPALAGLAAELAGVATVERFASASTSLPLNTVRALPPLARLVAGKQRPPRIFFQDAHLVSLALAAPWILPWDGSLAVSTLYLAGPERIMANGLTRAVVRRFLARPWVRLLLRTPELATAWRDCLPGSVAGRVAELPSLDLALPLAAAAGQEVASPPVRFGAFGQVQPGKSLDRLVPLFAARPDLGRLMVAGPFMSDAHRREMPFLSHHPDFVDRFLPEDELLCCAAGQHYLLMLYDRWDHRMEAATLSLAAAVRRPPLLYNLGWGARMIAQFGCGVAIEPGGDLAAAIAALPMPGCAAYHALQLGLDRYREAHSPARLCPLTLSVLLG